MHTTSVAYHDIAVVLTCMSGHIKRSLYTDQIVPCSYLPANAKTITALTVIVHTGHTVAVLI